ncbi:MAG: acetate--CoA ligase alpha subunit [Patescibacteria group bacterium]
MFDFIFNPKSIAVIGASQSKGKLGHDILNNVKKFGYKGKIYPINPKTKKILGLKSYKSVLSIKEKVDLAVIVVPAEIVNKVLIECGKKKIRGAVIISAGFKETGKEGGRREKLIQKTAKKYKIKLVGPNCLGFINPHINLNASFASGLPDKGNVGFVSQSGAMAVAMLDWAYQSEVGFSKILSIGNKADISEVDMLSFLEKDKETEVIMMYLESITNGPEFMQKAARVTRKKPVIILKAGKSEHGIKAISSHTGSLAGSDAVIDTAFKQSGVIRARTVEDLFDFACAFSKAPLPKGPNTAIITNAGGPGIMATDSLANTELKLAQFTDNTIKKLDQSLPDTASIENPVDIIGDALLDRYEVALLNVIKDPNVDSVITILTPQTMTQEDETAEFIAKMAKRTNKPIICSFMGGEDVNSGRDILRKNGIANFEYPDRAVRAMSRLYRANQIKSNKGLAKCKEKINKIDFDTESFQLKTIDCEKILSKNNLPVLNSKLITDPRDITDFPVVMKIASRDIVHKMASGALKLNIQNHLQAKLAFKQIIKNVKKIDRKNEIEGILVQPTVEPGQEIIIGMKRDSNFGPVILFGMGGSFVEIMKDFSLRVAPFCKKDAIQMIKEIKAYDLIKDLDLKLIINTLTTVSHLAMNYPQIIEMDINPMIVYKKGGYIVDVRMLIK